MNTYHKIEFTELLTLRSSKSLREFFKDNFGLPTYKVDLIYGIHNKLDSEKWYIGQTKDLYQRLWNTRSAEGHCQMVVAGVHPFITNTSEFEFIVLEVVDSESLNYWESYYCIKYDSYVKGYNKSVDGKGRWQRGLITYINLSTRDVVKLPKGELPPKGFIRGGTTLDLICYYNPSTGRMIKLIEGSPVPEGYVKGNIIKGRSVYRNPVTGEVRRLKPDEDIPEGFILGSSTSGKKRVYSISSRLKLTLSDDEIRSSEIPDLRYGMPRGKEWWNDPKYQIPDIITK